jgi:hypothetical protein
VRQPGKDNPERAARDAAIFVCDRTVGRPQQAIHQHLTTDQVEPRPAWDVSLLTLEQQDQLWDLLQLMGPEAGGGVIPAG